MHCVKSVRIQSFSGFTRKSPNTDTFYVVLNKDWGSINQKVKENWGWGWKKGIGYRKVLFCENALFQHLWYKKPRGKKKGLEIFGN